MVSVMTNSSNKKQWAVFVSYASEDKENVAGPLCNILKAFGLSVWIDQTELKVGDSLRRKIDEGLACSRYGIVILSPDFIKKHYTNIELDGLAQREVDGRKVILPVWYNINADQLRLYSLPLADKIALKWQEGIATVAVKLLEVVSPDILQKHAKTIEGSLLANIIKGEQLRNLIASAECGMFYHVELDNDRDINVVASFLDEVRDWIDIWSELSLKEQAEAQLSFTQQLEELVSNDWSLWGGVKNLAYHFTDYSGKEYSVPMRTIILSIQKGKPKSVIHTKSGIIVDSCSTP